MYAVGEEVLIEDSGMIGTITKDHGDGSFDVKTSQGVLHVSEFDIIPNDLDLEELPWLTEEDDDLWEDLEPYRNLNTNYY